MKRHAAPIIAAILLLLPVLYVGSYLAMVRTIPRFVRDPSGIGTMDLGDGKGPTTGWFEHYAVCPSICKVVFWPLEQIDRKVRPDAWN